MIRLNNIALSQYFLLLLLIILAAYLPIAQPTICILLILLCITLGIFSLKPKLFFCAFISGFITVYIPLWQNPILKLAGKIKIYPADIIIAILAIYLAIHFIFHAKKHWFTLKSTKIFTLFFIWGSIAILRGLNSFSFSAIGESREYVLIMLFYFFILFIFTSKKDINNLILWASYTVPVMLASHFVYFFLLGGNAGTSGRHAFRFINATEALVVSFLLLGMIINYINKKKVDKKTTSFLAIITLSLVIVITQHRSVWVATIFGLLFILTRSKKHFFKGCLAIVVIMAFCLTVVPTVSNIAKENIAYSFSKSTAFLRDVSSDAEGSWRLRGWQAELDSARHHMIFGEGLGGYSEWFNGQSWSRVAVHNAYIMMLSKFGIVGIIIFFSGIATWFKEINLYIKEENNPSYILLARTIKTAMLAHLVFAFFYYLTMFFWIILGVGSILSSLHAKPKNKNFTAKTSTSIIATVIFSEKVGVQK